MEETLLTKYQQFCMKNWAQPVRESSDKQLYFSIGLAGETGEVCEVVKKAFRDSHVVDKEKLTKELGDVLWYLTNLATVCGITLSSIIDTNIQKLNERHDGTYVARASDSERAQQVCAGGFTYQLKGPHIEKLDSQGKHVKFISKADCPKEVLDKLVKIKNSEKEDDLPWE